MIKHIISTSCLLLMGMAHAGSGFTFRDHTPSVLQYEAKTAAGANVLYTQTCQPFIDCQVDSATWPKNARYLDVFVIDNGKKTHVDSVTNWFGFNGKTVTCELKSIVPGAVFYKCQL